MRRGNRYLRRHKGADNPSQNRDSAQRDRDRILYSDALQRLANVTQVATPGEGLVFHNRLTHTHEVAQIARRLAEKLVREQPSLAEQLGGIHPDVVEAAALAHDLGHPPFGHIAEEELDQLARTHGAPEGFEGNAQSFRVITKIEAHRSEYPGLDLTGATLNAVLKYPWFRDTRAKGRVENRYRKFGAYSSERADFMWARRGYGDSLVQSIEAAIMDHADSIAYSVHDLDDFYRAGLIPVENLVLGEDGEWNWFVERWGRIEPKIAYGCIEGSGDRLKNLLADLTLGSHYRGERPQRAHLRRATSRLIDQFIHGVRLEASSAGEPGLLRDPQQLQELRFLQALVKVYVIYNPRLATQQAGQREIVRRLFATYLDATRRRLGDFVPALFRDEVTKLPKRGSHSQQLTERETRIAVDIVASFTDAQAVLLYRRLTGTDPGSITALLHP